MRLVAYLRLAKVAVGGGGERKKGTLKGTVENKNPPKPPKTNPPPPPHKPTPAMGSGAGGLKTHAKGEVERKLKKGEKTWC